MDWWHLRGRHISAEGKGHKYFIQYRPSGLTLTIIENMLQLYSITQVNLMRSRILDLVVNQWWPKRGSLEADFFVCIIFIFIHLTDLHMFRSWELWFRLFSALRDYRLCQLHRTDQTFFEMRSDLKLKWTPERRWCQLFVGIATNPLSGAGWDGTSWRMNTVF